MPHIVPYTSVGGGAFRREPPLGARINWRHPLARGIVACWLANEGSGATVHDIVTGYHGTLSSGAAWYTTVGGEPLGRCIQLNSGYINIPTAPNTPSGHTWVVWNYHAGVGGYPVLMGYNNGSSYWEMVSNDSSNRLYQQMPYPTQYTGEAGTAYTGWYLYSMSHWGDGHTRGFQNGVAITDVTGSHVAPPANLVIGARPGGGSAWGGYISLAFMYNRGLTDNEHALLYKNPYCFLAVPQNVRGRFGPAAAAGGTFNRYFYEQHIARGSW